MIVAGGLGIWAFRVLWIFWILLFMSFDCYDAVTIAWLTHVCNKAAVILRPETNDVNVAQHIAS